MSVKRFYMSSVAVAAGLFYAIGPTSASPLVIPLPSRAISATPISEMDIPALLGTWQDGPCLLLPPGVVPFETVSDTITFHPDGTFTQVVNKATGTLRQAGRYTVAGSRLTLRFLGGSAQYEFSRNGERLLLRPLGQSKMGTVTLQLAPKK